MSSHRGLSFHTIAIRCLEHAPSHTVLIVMPDQSLQQYWRYPHHFEARPTLGDARQHWPVQRLGQLRDIPRQQLRWWWWRRLPLLLHDPATVIVMARCAYKYLQVKSISGPSKFRGIQNRRGKPSHHVRIFGSKPEFYLTKMILVAVAPIDAAALPLRLQGRPMLPSREKSRLRRAQASTLQSHGKAQRLYDDLDLSMTTTIMISPSVRHGRSHRRGQREAAPVPAIHSSLQNGCRHHCCRRRH